MVFKFCFSVLHDWEQRWITFKCDPRGLKWSFYNRNSITINERRNAQFFINFCWTRSVTSILSSGNTTWPDKNHVQIHPSACFLFWTPTKSRTSNHAKLGQFYISAHFVLTAEVCSSNIAKFGLISCEHRHDIVRAHINLTLSTVELVVRAPISYSYT